jgi:hypothetical protein
MRMGSIEDDVSARFVRTTTRSSGDDEGCDRRGGRRGICLFERTNFTSGQIVFGKEECLDC